PLRKLLPTIGPVDLSAVVLVLVISMLKLVTLQLVNGAAVPWLAVMTTGALMAVGSFLQLLFWILIIRALLSWFNNGYNPMEQLLQQLTEPMLAPIRKILPPLGGLDLSVLVLIIA